MARYYCQVFKGNITFNTSTCNHSSGEKQRIYMKESEGQWKTYFQGYGNPTTTENAFEFWNSSLTAIFWINDNGLIKQPVNFIQLHVQELIQLHIQANTSNSANGNYTMYIMYGTLSGFHSVFTEGEKYDKEDP